MNYKTCTTCGEKFEATEEFFHKMKAGKFGLRAICKVCRQEHHQNNRERHAAAGKKYYINNKEKIVICVAEYYKNNKEKCLAAKKEYYKNNKEKCATVMKKWYENNKEKVVIRGTEYRKNNKEKVAASKKEYYRNNKEKNKEKHAMAGKKYYRNNKERVAIRTAKWKKENPEKVTAYKAKRRAHKLNQAPYLTEAEQHQIDLIYKIREELGSNYHVDHIIPVSKGGQTHPDNLQIVTANYNLQKGSKLNFRKPTDKEIFDWC